MKPYLNNNMTHKLVTAPETMSALGALTLMRSRGIRHLPVVNEAGDLIVGILSDRDLIKIEDMGTPVAKLMSCPIFSFDVNTSLLTITNAMIEHKVSAFLVTNEGEVGGIVTSEDLLLLLSEMLSEQPSAKWVLSEFLVNPRVQKELSVVAGTNI